MNYDDLWQYINQQMRESMNYEQFDEDYWDSVSPEYEEALASEPVGALPGSWAWRRRDSSNDGLIATPDDWLDTYLWIRGLK